MIRVLHIVGSMGMGGIETFIMNMYREVNRDEIQFDFLVHTQNKAFYDDEIKNLEGNIYSVDSRRNGIFKYRKNLKNFFKSNQNRYNAIHFHVSSLSNIAPIFYAKKFGFKNIIIHGHSISEGNGFYHKLFHYINRTKVTKYADHLLACSNLVGQWLYKNQKFKILNNGIDVQKFSYSENKRNVVRDTLGIKDNILIGHVGSFTYAKNHKRIIDIFYEFKKEFPLSKLILIGDGILRENINNYVIEKKLSENVYFTGIQSDITGYLSSMDILLMPSIYEGFPVSLIEAQSSGLRCIVSSTITHEVKITDLVTFIDLKQPNQEWIESIINEINLSYVETDRLKYNKFLLDSDYNIKKIFKKLIQTYSFK